MSFKADYSIVLLTGTAKFNSLRSLISDGLSMKFGLFSCSMTAPGIVVTVRWYCQWLNFGLSADLFYGLCVKKGSLRNERRV